MLKVELPCTVSCIDAISMTSPIFFSDKAIQSLSLVEPLTQPSFLWVKEAVRTIWKKNGVFLWSTSCCPWALASTVVIHCHQDLHLFWMNGEQIFFLFLVFLPNNTLMAKTRAKLFAIMFVSAGAVGVLVPCSRLPGSTQETLLTSLKLSAEFPIFWSMMRLESATLHLPSSVSMDWAVAAPDSYVAICIFLL